MAKKKGESGESVVTYPGPGRNVEGDRKTLLTHTSDDFEVQLGGNTLKIDGPGTVEIRSESPDWSPIQVALHIACQCSKRGSYTIEEK